MKRLLYLIVISLITACYPDIDSSVRPIFSISSYRNQTDKRNLQACCQTYSFRNFASKTDAILNTPPVQVYAASNIFDNWTLIIDFTFTYVAPTQNPDILIQFVSPDIISFAPDTLKKSWLALPIEQWSHLKQNVDGTWVISFNSEVTWTQQNFPRVLAYQTGIILGLSTSEQPSSVMYPYTGASPNTYFDLGTNIKIQDLYGGSVCDQWTQQNKPSFSMETATETFSIGQKGYVVVLSKQEVWQYDAKDSQPWQRKNFPSFLNQNHTIFSYLDKGYALVSSSKGSSLWQYNSTSDQWIQSTSVIPFSTDKPLKSTVLNTTVDFTTAKAYIFFTDNTASNQLNCWEYNFLTNQWTQKAKNTAVSTTDFDTAIAAPYIRRMMFVLKNGEVWQYDLENNRWFNSLSFPINQASGIPTTLLDVRLRMFLITTDGEFWKYEVGTWSKLGSPFRSNTNFKGFTIKCKGFVLTNQGEFWQYTP